MGYVLLIDGDNINCSYMPCILNYIAEQNSTVDSICLFGKLSSAYLDDWKEAYPPGSLITKYDISENRKNNTDMRILCEALSLYYRENVRHFIILSSDQDMESVIAAFPKDVEVIVGYCPIKTSKAYLEALKRRKITTLDLNKLRGDLTQNQKVDIINSTMHSYLRYKLGASFFAYSALKEWIVERYPELSDLAVEDIVSSLHDVNITFAEDGCIIN